MTGGAGFSSDSRQNLENNERLRNKSTGPLRRRNLKTWSDRIPDLHSIRAFRRLLRRKRRRQHLAIIVIMLLFSLTVLSILLAY